MSIKSLIFSVIETIIKVVVVAIAISYIFKGITAAYDFGYRVFADEPMSINNPKTITVAVPESADVKSVASMLQEKGLIEDSNLFIIQELLSAYHNRIQPGIYDLSTGMTATEMLRIMGQGEESVSNDSDYYVPVESDDNIIDDEYTDEMYDDGIVEDYQDETDGGAEG